MTPDMMSRYQAISREIDRRVFIDIVSEGIQRDGQRVLDAISKDDRERLKAIALKYQRDAGLAQGGGGAGPGRIKTGRRGAATVHNAALAWLDATVPASTEAAP
jgi:hypothetical protein